MSNYSQNGGSRKDWRNFEQRRAQALAGNGAGGGGVDNYAYDNRSEPGTKFYNDNYGPNVVVPRIQGPNYAVSNSPSHSAGQMVGPTPIGFQKHGPLQPPGIGTYDDSYNPIQKTRTCRDIICLGFFAAAVGLMVVMAGYVFIKGDLKRITTAGSDEACKDEVLARLQAEAGKVSLSHHYSKNYSTSLSAANEIPLQYGIDPRFNPVDDVTDYYEEITTDFENSWQQIIYMCFIALGITIIMTILLRLFAGIIIWFVVIGVSLAAIGGSIALWIIYSREKKDYDDSVDGAMNKTELNGLFAGAIIASIFTVLILLVFLFMRKRIALVIKLFNEAGKAVHAMPFLLLQPLMTFAALGISLALWFTILLYIETAGEVRKVTTPVGPICEIRKNWFIMLSRWWNLFMMYWLSQFIIGCQHIIIAGAVSIWFFTRDKSRLGFPIMTSFKRLMRYHLGSIAFGSLIIAIVKLIRAILNWIQNRLCGTNAFCRGIICCCKCCVWCLEKFLMFLSRNAYIEIAIHGYGFCKAARKAFKLIVSNALRIAAINSIGDFVLFLGKITIVAATVAIGHEILKAQGNINHIWAPLTVAAICAYFIAHCFLSVYEMAIDTIFICFCEDCELNDGISKPYFMSKGLMEFVKNSEKVLKARKERKNK